MPGRSFRVARIAGIPIGISPLWLVVVAFITWSLGAAYYPQRVHGLAPPGAYALGLISALLLFASVLAHELGHALVARRRGIVVDEIDLWLLGGVARMRGRPHRAQDELAFAAAGPAVTAVVAALFGAIALALPHSAPPAVRALVGYQVAVNLLIFAFNLAPAFPLDGGRVTRALLWQRTGDLVRATDIAARMGRVFGFLLIGGGVTLGLGGAPGGLWFSVIGFFIVAAASAERLSEQVMAMLTGLSAGELMSAPAVTISAQLTLAEAARLFHSRRYTAFPVLGPGERVIGLLTLEQLERAPRLEQASVLIADVAQRDPALIVTEDTDVGELLEQPAFARIGRAAVVDAGGHAVGLLSLTDVQRAIRVERLGQRAGATRHTA